MDSSPPGSTVHEILQTRILGGGGLPCPSPGDLPDPGIEPMSLMSPALAGGFFLPLAPPVCLHKSHIFFICSSVDEYVGCFHTLDIINCRYEHWGVCFFSN